MQNLVVNSRIVAGELTSIQFKDDEIALTQLKLYRNHGLKPVARRSKFDWMAFIVTFDEETTLLVADGFLTEKDAVSAARKAFDILLAA
jgi:hypothetical protein